MEANTRQTFSPLVLDAGPAVSAAAEYARFIHRGQQRADGAPFILHPLEAAKLLDDAGHREEVIAAALLHDAVEHADVELADLEARFGPEVARLVSALTEDGGIPSFGDRKRALRAQVAAAGPEAAAIYAADKVSKARELRGMARAPGRDHPRPGTARMDHYRRSLAMLERKAPGDPLVRQLRHELEAL